MIKAVKTLLLASLIVGTSAYAAGDLDEFQSKVNDQWVLLKNDRLHSIKTFTKKERDKRIRSFRIEAIIDASLESYMRMTLDIDSYKKWYFEVSESKVLRRNSPTDYYIYLVHNAPFGIPDRDVISHVTIEPQGPGRPYITISHVAVPDFMPLKPPYVRMAATNYGTRLTPLPGGKILQETEGYIDPGGNDPTWAVNFVQRSGPYNTQVSINRRLQHPEILNNTTPLPFPVYDADHLP